jgi:hypothetical protein
MSSSGNGNGRNPDKKLEDFLKNLQELEARESNTLTKVRNEYEGEIERLKEELSKLTFYHNYDKKTLGKIIDDNIITYKKHLSENRKTNKELCDKNSGLDSENQRLKAENEELKKKLAVMLEAEAKRLEQEEKDKECPICMCARQDEVKTKCGHCFCRLCIIDSMKRKSDCPLCRQEIKESFDLPKVGGGVLQNTPPSSSGSGGRVQNSPPSSNGGGGRVQQQLGHVSTRGGGHPDDDSDDYSDDDSDDGWASTMTRNIMENGGDFGDNY